MESSSQDRNLPASQRKLRKAQDDGQVTRSRDLSHLVVLGTGALTMLALAPMMFERIKRALAQHLSFDAQALIHPQSMLARLDDLAMAGLVGCVAFAAFILVASVVSTVLSGGWVSSLKPVLPDLSRLDPLTGFGRLFTKDKLIETAKLLFITAVLSAVGASYLGSGLEPMASLLLQPSTSAIVELTHWLTRGVGLLLLVVLVVALIDVPVQSLLHKARLKMSHQEVKQEHKESEGNPQARGQMRARQREIANGNSVKAVSGADFVVMNPTHYAVALKYDEQAMRAPRVIAKGADLLALKIREIATSHAIPVLESPRLARALYTHAELDLDIPSSLYAAVAQVLAYVYRLKAALAGRGPMPEALPEPSVPSELDPLATAPENHPVA